MWTHRAPYAPSELTVASIERHGRMALSRALHYDRLVAFVGSGVSAAYGGPSWSKLLELMIEAVDAAFEDVAKVRRERADKNAADGGSTDTGSASWDRKKYLPDNLRRLYEQLHDLLDLDPEIGELKLDLKANAALGGQMTTMLALCEDTLRAAAADLKTFPLSSERSTASESAEESDAASGAATPRAKRSEVDRKTPRERLANLINSFVKDSHTKDGGSEDVLGALAALGVNRFATLNYDTLLESRLRRLDDELLAKRAQGEPAPNKRKEPLDPLRVGDLLNFAVLDAGCPSQVVHIHGHVDRPDRMVLTEDDYRRVYVGAGNSDGELGEATRALFAGNDILFLGVGLKEDDVMGPLRAVLVQEKAPDADARQTLALMAPSAAPFAAETTRKPGESGKRYAARMSKLNDAAERKRARDDALFTIHQKLKYGVNVLRYGARDGLFLKGLRFAETALRDLYADDFVRRRLRSRLRQFASEIARAEPGSTVMKASDAEALRGALVVGRRDDQTDEARTKACLELKGRLLARALKAELESIGAKKGEWWDDWRRLPRERWARLHNRAEPEAPYPIWARHCPKQVTAAIDLSPLPPPASSSPFLEAAKIAATRRVLWSRGWNRRRRSRILRFTLPRGGGKGAFIRSLFDPAAHQALFDHTDYDGAFFVHTSFSIEFSSVVSALSRFLAGTLARVLNKPELVEEWEESPEKALATSSSNKSNDRPFADPTGARRLNRLEVLRALLERYAAATEGTSRRMFVCLGGMERLCDERGDAHNPMHRAFFRLLTGSGETLPGGGPGDPPIDLVLVSSWCDTPIAYLSEEAPSGGVPVAERHRYANVSATGRVLREWDRLPRMPWSARLKLTPSWAEKAEKADPIDRAHEALCALLKDEDLTRPPGPLTAARSEFWRSVALSAWGFSNFEEWAKRQKPPVGDLEPRAEKWLLRMSRAAARGQFEGVLKEILRIYDELDAVSLEKDPDHDPRLCRIVLEHLALFALPIEILVLYLCPDIYGRLNGAVSGNRSKRFNALKAVLGKLVRRGLVMEVLPGHEAGKVCQKKSDDEGRIHIRYVIHDQLRQTIARGIDLVVPDGGDRNHFEVSLYGEQPRDTPTPSYVHFGHVRDIVRLQIKTSRELLRALYVLMKAIERGIEERHVADIETSLPIIEQICFGDEKDLGLFAWLGRLHAMPQRLRAGYALLRGTFSVGALTRLSAEDIGPDHEKPFDLYRDWLRSLVNAGVGVHEIKPIVHWALRGEFASKNDETRYLHAGHRTDARVHTGSSRRKELFQYPLQQLETRLSHAADAGLNVGKAQAALGKLMANDGAARRQKSEVTRLSQPFYIDEIAWLLNERGLASYIQGRIYDAIAHYDRALAVVARDPRGSDEPSFFASERRIRLNRAIALIDHGLVSEAQDALDDICVELAPFAGGTPSPTLVHAKGYLAFCDHLTGNLARARSAYEKAIETCNAAGNLRAAAIYGLHLASLFARLGELDQARSHLQIALAAAAQAGQQDVRHFGMIKQAQLFISEGKPRRAVENAALAEEYGLRLGLHRIRAEALFVRSEALLQQGDAKLAGGLAAEAIAISQRHGMRLGRVRATVLYGEILFARNKPEMARQVLERAHGDASLMRYQAKASRAKALLDRAAFAIPLAPPSWAGGSASR